MLSQRDFIRTIDTIPCIGASRFVPINLGNFVFRFFSLFFDLFVSNQHAPTQIVYLFSNFNAFKVKAAT